MSGEEVLRAAERMGKSDYADFLRRRVAEGRSPPLPHVLAGKAVQ
jgi:hypothetical protein